MSTGVHGQSSGATSEAISLGSELPAVAGLAVQHSLVAVLVRGVKSLVAHTAFEAFLVELQVAHSSGFCCVNRFAACWALDLCGGLEGHFGRLRSRY